MPTRAADDFATIGRRIVELRAERDALRQCTCPDAINANGEKMHSAGCPVHGALRALAAMARDVRFWRPIGDPTDWPPVRPRLDTERLQQLRELLARHGIRVEHPSGAGE